MIYFHSKRLAVRISHPKQKKDYIITFISCVKAFSTLKGIYNISYTI